MPMTDETDDSGGVILDGPFDPDAQATVTDFIDYTEYLPADLIRSLTLIRGLDDRYLDSAQAVHQLTQIYGQLPDLPPDNRPGAIALRKDISSQVDRAINARESAYAEACRLYDVVDRHFDRLGCIRQKLEALPKPASAEPSPPPEPTPKRARGGKKTNKDATTRITLRLDNNRNRRDKNRRRMLGADGAFDPDSPLASTEQSDLESELIKTAPKPARPPKKEKARRLSSGIGQSTAQALAQLKPPPADAKLGSEDLPWLRLTEWEMTRLRKKMKKNAVWQPSEVMIHRELALANRGWEAYRTAKALAEETGEEFIDCDNIEETRRGEAAKDLEETKLSNRGMKLNEAKKLKREQLAREQALMEGEGGALPRPLPTQAPPPANRASRKRKREEVILGATELVAPEPPKPTPVSAPVAPPVPVPAPSFRAGPSRRRSSRGAVPAAETHNDLILPIKINMSPVVEAKPSPPPISPTSSGQSNLPLVKPVTTPTPPLTRPSSRRSAAAASIEGGTLITIPTAIAASGRDRRIKSATPAHKTPIRESSNAPSVPAPARRRKRPAPGPISTGQDGGAAVSYGRRKAKPGKKRLSIRDSQDVRVDEDGVLEQIDANEPRYCLCGDVSFGTMICCENQDCDREWFHLNCVGLTEVPSRTAKWYCPQCRVKLHKGEDGIIKGSSRR
ncbi:Zinc finger PHD-type [Penicillium concentricum]|uniref:Chromatin modification-related protein n=1 Tax=Penicillium concentricum TaxID=293559 RepID=A0A9W9VKR1_9EURO|nr:Zinc finger PHD-type [Penicillium concentricum]KAJ5384489.1 Zinc finger PHD-type [Penicillium concentricum]